MATAATVDLGPPHPPKAESIKAFKEAEHELKKELVHHRHNLAKHEPEYFAAAAKLSDHELAGFTVDNFELVRVAESSYGYHLLCKVRVPALPSGGPAYLHFRLFSEGPGHDAKFHSFHTEEKEHADGNKTYRAIFNEDDPLEWFST